MNQPRVTLLASQDKLLRAHFSSHAGAHERAAVVLFKRLNINIGDLSKSDRYIAVAVHPFEDRWVTGSSPSHIAFETQPLREFFRRCEEESLVFGFAHNHPTGFPDFSDTDDTNELTLLEAISNRNGRDISFVALLWANETWKARVRTGLAPEQPVTARHVLVTDRPMRIYSDNKIGSKDDAYARQAAAFGMPFVHTLQSLRVAVIGVGGTGSPTATLLARSGIGELVLIDPDDLEASNLNRVRGAARRDVGKNKAVILERFISSLDLHTKVTGLSLHVDSPEGIDALASCDVVLGCTDDQIGREALNTAAYAYAQPYIDVGLGGQVAVDANGRPYLRYHHGRVSTILPEAGECLFCQGVLTEHWIRRDYALRENPNMDDAQARERYLEGGAEQAPGVGPFTSAIADFGVATLFDLISLFRKFPGELRWDAFSIDFVQMALQSTSERSDSSCPYCGSRQFLVMQEKQRLNRPILGVRDAAL
jgi:molybdopterin-synthase adenylyltransferase